MAERHDVLRTTLTDLRADPDQHVSATIELPFSYVDLTAVTESRLIRSKEHVKRVMRTMR